MPDLVWAVPVGIGATIVMDLWGILLKRAFGVRALSYTMVGRWIGNMPAGRFAHRNIAAAPPVAGEGAIGWAAHYGIGILFAGILVVVGGHNWLSHPTLLPALLVGVSTVAAPFLLMQPALGLGFAASKTPSPNIARLRSLATHAVFGLGLYASARLVAPFMA